MSYFVKEQKAGETRGDADLFHHGKQLISRSDINTTIQLRSLNDRYYDGLNPDEQKELSKVWDGVAYPMLRTIKKLNDMFKTSDALDKHDIQRQMVEVKFFYEVDRFHSAYQHYLNSKRYKEPMLEEE